MVVTGVQFTKSEILIIIISGAYAIMLEQLFLNDYCEAESCGIF